MMSGNVGMTSTTSVNNESESSTKPPMYAALMPMATERIVQKNPTTKAINTDWRVP